MVQVYQVESGFRCKQHDGRLLERIDRQCERGSPTLSGTWELVGVGPVGFGGGGMGLVCLALVMGGT